MRFGVVPAQTFCNAAPAYQHSPVMRAALVLFTLLLALVSGLAPAHASVIVVMTDRPGELGAALEVALANRRVDIARLPAPHGRLRLDRAAAAQRAALAAGADAAIWIDLDGTTDVCAVSSDGRYFRHAPIDEVSPRVFAAIATSLLDELLAPPEGALDINVDVHVNVTPPHPVVAVATPDITIAAAPVITEDNHPVRHDRTLFEIGAMLTPVSAGVEGALLFPLTPRWRAGVMGTVNQLFGAEGQIFAGMLELRRVGLGTRRHFDFSFMGGGATANGEAVSVAGIRLNWMWEGASSGTSFGVAPLVIYTGSVFLPGIFASLRWGVTL